MMAMPVSCSNTEHIDQGLWDMGQVRRHSFDDDEASLTARLQTFYQVHNPSADVAKATHVAKQFLHKQAKLNERLRQKYGDDLSERERGPVLTLTAVWSGDSHKVERTFRFLGADPTNAMEDEQRNASAKHTVNWQSNGTKNVGTHFRRLRHVTAGFPRHWVRKADGRTPARDGADFITEEEGCDGIDESSSLTFRWSRDVFGLGMHH